VQRRIPDRPSDKMTVNDIAEVVQLVTTNEARSAEADVIDRQSHPGRRVVMRPNPETMLDVASVTDPQILLSHCHVLRIVHVVRKLVVTDRHQAMMTEIALIAITEIVTAVDAVDAGDPDGNASLLRTTIPLMTEITVTGPVVADHQNLTG